MTRRPLENMVQNLRKLVTAQALGHLPDGQLLGRFLAREDPAESEAAFTELVERHGTTILRKPKSPVISARKRAMRDSNG